MRKLFFPFYLLPESWPFAPLSLFAVTLSRSRFIYQLKGLLLHKHVQTNSRLSKLAIASICSIINFMIDFCYIVLIIVAIWANADYFRDIPIWCNYDKSNTWLHFLNIKIYFTWSCDNNQIVFPSFLIHIAHLNRTEWIYLQLI